MAAWARQLDSLGARGGHSSRVQLGRKVHWQRDLLKGEVDEEVSLFDTSCIATFQGAQASNFILCSKWFGCCIVAWDSYLPRSTEGRAVHCPYGCIT